MSDTEGSLMTQFPATSGHEVAGVITELGGGVGRWRTHADEALARISSGSARFRIVLDPAGGR